MAISKQFRVKMVENLTTRGTYFILEHIKSGKVLKEYRPNKAQHGARFAAKRALGRASADCRAANNALVY